MDDFLIRMLGLGQKGYNCSQILMLLALEQRGDANPDLVRAVGGLAYGCGSGRADCGALTGGCCVLGLYAGKGDDQEISSEQLPLMLQELSDWFDGRVGRKYGGISCNAVVGDGGPAASRQSCGAIVAETYGKVMEILAGNGLVP